MEFPTIGEVGVGGALPWALALAGLVWQPGVSIKLHKGFRFPPPTLFPSTGQFNHLSSASYRIADMPHANSFSTTSSDNGV